MDNTNKIINFWGDELVKIPKNVFEGLEIDVETRNYLEFVGLPKSMNLLNEVLNITFYFDSNDICEIIYQSKKFVIIGDDFGSKICLKIDTGQVFSIDIEDENELCCYFINSKIEKFITFLMIFGNYQKLANSEINSQFEIINRMKSDFNIIDKNSLSESKNWWSMVLVQP